MAGTPTLGELTGIRPEANKNPIAILDGRETVSQLNQSAQFNAEMANRRYEQGLAALKAFYQDLGAIQETPIMREDRPVIYKNMADVLNIIAEDPRAALSGPHFAELQQRMGALRSMTAASKQDNVYQDFNEKFLKQNPDLDTPQNREKLSSFTGQPLGARKQFLLDTPVKFDPELQFKNILLQKSVGVPYANTSFEGPNNEWMIRETGTTYGRDAALRIWDQGFATARDVNNQPVSRWAEDRFNEIKNDPEQFEAFGKPANAKEFWDNLFNKMWGTQGDITGEKTSTRTANPYTVLSSRQANALYMEAIREGNREKLASLRAYLQLQPAPENTNFLLRQYANVVGNVTGQTNNVETSKGHFEKEDVVDVPGNILKIYAQARKETLREGHSTDPVEETIIQGNTPDLVTRTKDGNLRLTFYQHYAKTDKIPKGKHVGDIVTDTGGVPILSTSGVIPRRNLLATLGKGVIETKRLSASIDQADKALQSDANTIMDKINSGEDDGTTAQQAHQTVHENNKRSYKFNGRTYTLSQIEKAAKASGMTVEEYIKKAGIQ